MPAEAIIEVRNVGKTYDSGVEALRDINLALPRGELSTFLGPSGCGKTTLLKIIAGLISPSDGELWVKGNKVSGPGPERAFVFQDFALLPWASVLRNVAFGLELRGMPEERAPGNCPQVYCGSRIVELRVPLSAPTLRRNETAGRARPGARHRRRYRADGRAFLLGR